jgi:PKD repeat protein
MRLRKQILLYTFLISVLTGLFCSQQDIPNPLLPRYTGDYRFTVSFDLKQDTLSVFTPYILKYKSIGKDAFVSFKIKSDEQNLIDTAVFKKNITDSTFVLYLLQPFKGNIKIIGVHPNQKETEQDLPVIVKNAFKITGPESTTVGDTATYLIAGAHGLSLNAKWFVNDLPSQNGTALMPLKFVADSVKVNKIVAIIADTLGNTISSDTFYSTVISKVPVLAKLPRSREVPNGQLTSFVVNSQYADSIKWYIKKLGKIFTTGAASKDTLKVTFLDTGVDTLIVTAFNKYQQFSKPETLFLNIMSFTYTLQLKQSNFPDTVIARQLATWKVNVLKNGELFSQQNIMYDWKTIPPGVTDSISALGMDSLQMFFRDSIPAFTFNIRARIGGDSTQLESRTIVVRRYKPTCSFPKDTIAVEINKDTSIVIDAKDSNINGSIAAIYYSTSINNIPVLIGANRILPINFSQLGIHTIKLSCVDNDGFSSDTQKLVVNVTAKKPYFLRSKIDTTIFINDSIHLTLAAFSENVNAPIIAYDWDFNNANTWNKTTTTSRLDTIFTNAGIVSIKVRCRNAYSTSETAMVTITVSDGKPAIHTATVANAIAFYGDMIHVNVKATDINGTCQKIAFKFNSSVDSFIILKPSKNIDTTLSLQCKNIGKFPISIAVIDNDRKYSDYTITDSITVKPFLPTITPKETWINDSLLYTIGVSSGKMGIKERIISWDNGLTWETTLDSTIKRSFTTIGINHIKIVVKDKNGFLSDTLKDSIRVNEGRPTAAVLKINNSPITDSTVWVRHLKEFTLRGTDPNGSIKRWAVKWEAGQPFTVQNDSVFRYTFNSAGNYTISHFVIDDDSLHSDTLNSVITVKDRKPEVVSITPDTLVNAIYINDLRKFTIRCKDTIGVVDSIKVDNGSGTYSSFVHVTGDSLVFHKTFISSDSGSNIIRVIAKNTDGLVSDPKELLVNVRIGRPVITGLSIDTTAGNIFVKDTRKFTITFNDINGSIKKVYASWNNGVSWDSLAVNISGTGTHTFEYNFDTLGAGNKTLRFRVRDDDTVFSVSKDTAITVRLGAPVLWGDNPAKDTIWVKVNNDYGNYYYKPQYADTNGTIDTFYFGLNSNINQATKSTVDSALIPVDLNNINKGSLRYIWVKDNDGIIRGRQITVFADSIPPAPQATYSSDGSQKIMWSGKDAVDGDATQFKILVKKGTSIDSTEENNPAYIVQDFKAGSLYTVELNSKYSFIYTPTNGFGDYYYMVIARDARGSINRSSRALYFTF